MEPINHADDNELQQAINNISGNGTEPQAPAGGMPPFTPPMPSSAPINTAATGDLRKVKTMALSDLRPVLDKVDMPAEGKFKIYREIIESTKDKASIEPAYAAAKSITDDKLRAEALLYIVETIDKLS